MIKEGAPLDKLYLVKEGRVQILKEMAYQDEAGRDRWKSMVLLDVNEGDFVGEESLKKQVDEAGEVRSQYTVKVDSRAGAVLYVASSKCFSSSFRQILPEIQKMCEEKALLLENRQNLLMNQLRYWAIKNRRNGS